MTGPGAERTGLSTRHQGARMLSFKDIRMFKTGPGFHGIYTVGTSLECCSFQRGTRIMRWKHAPHSSSPKWAERGVHRSFFKAQTAIFNSCVRVCVCACVWRRGADTPDLGENERHQQPRFHGASMLLGSGPSAGG